MDVLVEAQLPAGTEGIDVNTQGDYSWRLKEHRLPHFSKHRLDEIDAAACQAFKAKKLEEAHELRTAIEAGAVLRDRSGKRARPLERQPEARADEVRGLTRRFGRSRCGWASNTGLTDASLVADPPSPAPQRSPRAATWTIDASISHTTGAVSSV